jgi:hypothetical protein
VVLASEKRFYNKFAITKGHEPREALAILQERVREWNLSGAQKLISADAHTTVINILTDKRYHSLSLDELNSIVNDLFQPGGGLYDENQEITTEKVIKILNEELEELELSKFRINDKSLYWIEVKNGQIEIKGNIDANRKSRLKKALQNIVDKKLAGTKKKAPKIVGGDSERNAALLREILLAGISNEEVKNKLRYELSAGRIDKFNLARDYGVIKGFLGEVYWSAFFRYLGA